MTPCLKLYLPVLGSEKDGKTHNFLLNHRDCSKHRDTLYIDPGEDSMQYQSKSKYL